VCRQSSRRRLELIAREDEALLVRRDARLVLDLTGFTFRAPVAANEARRRSCTLKPPLKRGLATLAKPRRRQHATLKQPHARMLGTLKVH